MMSLTFGLFTQVSGSGPLGPLVLTYLPIFFCFFEGDLKQSIFFCLNFMTSDKTNDNKLSNIPEVLCISYISKLIHH